jgi:hypothetical protein
MQAWWRIGSGLSPRTYVRAREKEEGITSPAGHARSSARTSSASGDHGGVAPGDSCPQRPRRTPPVEVAQHRNTCFCRRAGFGQFKSGPDESRDVVVVPTQSAARTGGWPGDAAEFGEKGVPARGPKEPRESQPFRGAPRNSARAQLSRTSGRRGLGPHVVFGHAARRRSRQLLSAPRRRRREDDREVFSNRLRQPYIGSRLPKPRPTAPAWGPSSRSSVRTWLASSGASSPLSGDSPIVWLRQ